MLQFLKFDKNRVEEAEFSIITGVESLKFFTKRFGYIVFFLYSTIFVAAIDPFVNSSMEKYVFFIGGFITSIIIIRVCNHVLKYINFSGGKLSLKSNRITVHGNKEEIEILSDNLINIEINPLGNIVFHEKNKATVFPLMLISDADKEKLVNSFSDTAANRTHLIKKVYDFIDALLVAFILAMHIREYIIQAYFIPSGSMEDTLLIGDHLLVEKITYGPVIPKMMGMEKEIHLKFLGIRDIERNDIVIFKPPDEIERDFIKRCIALPGDDLQIKNNAVYVNDKKLDESFTKGFTNYDGFGLKRIDGIVPEGMIVVFGDNRENSSDSRAFGYLPIERVKGKAFILYWNTQHIKNLDFSRIGLIR
ncbi:MAG: signal peptidase I [Spirochaetes bacterium]|nr:signal peptidase I [Spirochaetota bacterium]